MEFSVYEMSSIFFINCVVKTFIPRKRAGLLVMSKTVGFKVLRVGFYIFTMIRIQFQPFLAK